MTNSKELKIGAFLSFSTIILGCIIQIFYTPLYIKYLGTSDYGINSLVQSLMGYMGMLNLGLGNAMLRYTVRYRSEGKIEEEQSLNGMFLIIFSFLMLVSLIIGTFIYISIPDLFGNKFTITELEKTRKVFLIMALNISTAFPLSIFVTNVTSHEKFIFQKSLSTLNIVFVPIISVILMKLGFGIIGITVLTVIFSIGINILNLIYAFKLGMKLKFNNIDWKILKEIFKYSFFIFLNIIVDRIYWGTDRVIIGKYIGTGAITIYSIASIFNILYMNLSTAISGVLFPKINRIVVEDNSDKKLSDLFIKTGRIQYILMGLISTGFILYGKDFIILWLRKEYLKSYSIALWIMIPLTIPLIQNIGTSILQAKNMHAFRSIVYIFIALLNILISIFLVKIYGEVGCAIATGISFTLGNIIIINIYYYKKINIDIPKFWKEIFKMSIPILIVFITGYIFNIYYKKVTWIVFILKSGIYSLIYGILMLFLGMNNEEKQLVLKPIDIILKKLRSKK